MSGDVIGSYLADLGRRLPPGITDEIADGLAVACEKHLARGLSEDDAAHAAVAEFGDARQLAAEFTRQSAGRRTARIMLASGPAVGACWAAALIAARAWTWPVPATARLGFGTALLLVIAALACSAASRHSYRLTRLSAPAGIGIIVLDITVITGSLAIVSSLTWLLAIAVTASALRIGLAARLVPRAIAR